MATVGDKGSIPEFLYQYHALYSSAIGDLDFFKKISNGRYTCLPDAGHDVWLSFNQAADVMPTGVNHSTTFIVCYTRINTCQQYRYIVQAYWMATHLFFTSNADDREDPMHIKPLFTARCTLVQSAVLRSHVVSLSVCPSVRLSVCDVGGLW